MILMSMWILCFAALATATITSLQYSFSPDDHLNSDRLAMGGILWSAIIHFVPTNHSTTQYHQHNNPTARHNTKHNAKSKQIGMGSNNNGGHS